MRRARTIVAILEYTKFSTCVVPVSAMCANAHLLSFGGDLVLEFTTFILVYITTDVLARRPESHNPPVL